MTCAPLLVLAALELALRWAGFGYDTSLFHALRVDGKDYFVPNEQFGYRFFPPAIARSLEPFRIPAVKFTNSYRIFLFGESAANGDPDATYGMWRYLEVLLRDRFPGIQFEVICVAMTASDSNVILPTARECAGHDGDLWLFYMGNNEMVGPFGAETSYGWRAPGRAMIRVVLAMKKLRVVQLVDDLVQRFRGGSAPQKWGGMQMFAKNRLGYSDPARLRAYSNFQGNLEDILAVARKTRVPVILSTVAVNLRECPPFASMHDPALGSKQASSWEQSFGSGVLLESNRSFAEAVQSYEAASQIDPHYAELAYRKARCELALGNRDEARRDFELACDSDALEFRADSRINAAIRDAAVRHAGQDVRLLDGEAVVASVSPEGIPGLGHFYEHVHLNFSGNYRLALGFAEETRKYLPASMTTRDKGGWCSQETCEDRLAVTVWDRQRVWKPILSRIGAPPFSEQFDHVAMMKSYDSKLAEVRAQMDTQTPAQARQMYQEAIKLSPDDYFLHGNFQRFLEAGGFLSQAVEQARRCCELVPWLPGGYYYVGKLLVEEGRISEAVDYFKRALAIRGSYAEPLNGLAEIRANQRRISEAVNGFRRAIRANPNWVEPYLNLGFLEEQQGDRRGAFDNYAKAAALEPEGPADYFNRAALAAARYQWDDVIVFLRGVLKAKPEFWQAHYLLGIQLGSKGASEEAEQQFRRALRFRPDFLPARLNLGAVLVAQGNLEAAIREYRTVQKFDPANSDARRQIDAIETQLQHVKSAGSNSSSPAPNSAR